MWERGRGRVRESDTGCGAKQAGRVRWLASGRERAVAAWWSGPGKETQEQAGLWCGPCGEKDRAARGLIWATGLDLRFGFWARGKSRPGWVELVLGFLILFYFYFLHY